MLNNINIFNMSLLLAQFLNGSFSKIEAELTAIPFKIGHKTFHKEFMLFGGIYPCTIF